MNISLTPELEKYVNKQVESGFYHSSSEVIRAALRLLAKYDTNLQSYEFENYKMWLNQEIQIGLDQVAHGRLIEGNEALKNFKRFRQKQINANSEQK